MRCLPSAAMRPLWIIVSLLLVASPAGTSGAAPAGASAAAAEYRAKDPAKPLVARKRTRRPALTEAEALRLAQGDTVFGQVHDARVDVARSDVVEAGLPPNPELGLSYESSDGAGDPSETTLRLSQTFDTSGRRAERDEVAGSLAQAWEPLLALLGVEDRRYAAVDGRLLPPSPPPSRWSPALRGRRARRPDPTTTTMGRITRRRRGRPKRWRLVARARMGATTTPLTRALPSRMRVTMTGGTGFRTG